MPARTRVEYWILACVGSLNAIAKDTDWPVASVPGIEIKGLPIGAAHFVVPPEPMRVALGPNPSRTNDSPDKLEPVFVRVIVCANECVVWLKRNPLLTIAICWETSVAQADGPRSNLATKISEQG